MSKLFRADRVLIREPLTIPLAALPRPASVSTAAAEDGKAAEREARRQAQAAAQAEQILRQAEKDAEALYRQARGEAVAEGRRLGRARGERMSREYLDREAAGQAEVLRRCTARQEKALADVETEVRRQATELAFVLASHILHAPIDGGASRFRSLEEEVFAAAGKADARGGRSSRPAVLPKGDDAVA